MGVSAPVPAVEPVPEALVTLPEPSPFFFLLQPAAIESAANAQAATVIFLKCFIRFLPGDGSIVV